MYEMDEAWTAYFEETDPGKRLKLFDNLPDSGDGARDFCRMLYQRRYTNPKHPGEKADMWLWKFVYLPGLYKKKGFLRKALRKEMQGTMEDLYLDRAEELDDMKKAMLYQEFRNAARRYLSTCKGDKYGSRLLGLKRANQQEKMNRACEDIWIVSRGLACAVDLEETFSLWNEALYDELMVYAPDSREHYEKLEASLKMS